jgi:hypothetical protein
MKRLKLLNKLCYFYKLYNIIYIFNPFEFLIYKYL